MRAPPPVTVVRPPEEEPEADHDLAELGCGLNAELALLSSSLKDDLALAIGQFEERIHVLIMSTRELGEPLGEPKEREAKAEGEEALEAKAAAEDALVPRSGTQPNTGRFSLEGAFPSFLMSEGEYFSELPEEEPERHVATELDPIKSVHTSEEPKDEQRSSFTGSSWTAGKSRTVTVAADPFFQSLAITYEAEEAIKEAISRSRTATKRETLAVDGRLLDEEDQESWCARFFAPLLEVNECVRRFVSVFVTHRYFELFFCMLILSNTVFFGVEAEYMVVHKLIEAPQIFKTISLTYTYAFISELLLRLYVHGRDFFCGPESGWNIFDAIIVLFSVVEMMVVFLLEQIFDDPVEGAKDFTYMRMIKIARTGRTLRVIRIFSFFRSLRLLVLSLFNTLKSLFWTVLLLVVILYMVGVLFTQAATQHLALAHRGEIVLIPAMEDYWGSVPKSVNTLFKSLTNGVSWQIVLEPLEALDTVWMALFVAYIAFTHFALLNVVTGVFCNTAIENAKRDQDEVMHAQQANEKSYAEQLTELFEDVDVDRSGELTIDEFEDLLQDERLQKYCASLDITIDDAWSLFKLLDSDGSGSIGVDEFVKGCLRLRGNARGVDVALQGYQLRWIIARFEKFIAFTDSQFKVLVEATEPSWRRKSSLFNGKKGGNLLRNTRTDTRGRSQ